MCIQHHDSRGWLPYHTVGCISYKFLPGKSHYGIDLNAPADTEILASADGVVFKAGWNDLGLGNRIIINHPGNLQTIYGHNSKVLVKPGEKVIKGQTIAIIGSTGNTKAAQTGNSADGIHLHFEVLKNDNWEDPMKYF